MAMNAAALEQQILSELAAAGFDVANPSSKTKELIAAISKGVVTHIQTNAQVTTTVTTPTGPGAGAGTVS